MRNDTIRLSLKIAKHLSQKGGGLYLSPDLSGPFFITLLLAGLFPAGPEGVVVFAFDHGGQLQFFQAM